MSDESSSSEYEAPEINSRRKRKVKSKSGRPVSECLECRRKYSAVVASEDECSLDEQRAKKDDQIQISDSEQEDDALPEHIDPMVQRKCSHTSVKSASFIQDWKRARIGSREDLLPHLDFSYLPEEDRNKPSCSRRRNRRFRRANFAAKNQGDRNLLTSKSIVDYNIFNGSPENVEKSGLRPIIIDGSNVAYSHGKRKKFSSRGIEICVNYFLSRNHKVYAFVPQYRACVGHSEDTDILHRLEKDGHLIFTPSRWVEDKLIKSYDDRFIVQSAAELGGVIVARDNYRDLMTENPLWEKTIKERLLMYTWVEDLLIFPVDPLGRNGPTLEEFLKF